jgi:hypothetical protein
VRLDFELPRFGVSLVTIAPAARGGEGGPPPTRPSESGCACRVGKRGDGEVWLLAMCALAVVAVARHRNAAAHGRTPPYAN